MRGRSGAIKKTVSFTATPPEFHVIPNEMASWLEGERSPDPPPDVEAKAKQLTAQAFAEAAREEAQASSYTFMPSNWARQIRRKPVPDRADSVYTVSTDDTPRSSQQDFDPRGYRSMPDRELTDFVPQERLQTWDEAKENKCRNLHPARNLAGVGLETAIKGFDKAKKGWKVIAGRAKEETKKRN